jgi:hypothetical protein
MGLGKGLRMKLRGELRMIERAIRQGWETPPAEQERALRLALSVVDDENATQREQLAALRVLDAIVQQQASAPSQIRKRAIDALRYQQEKALRG